MSYKLAVFDFDGTLADSLSAFVAAVNEAAPRFGFRQIDRAELPRLRGYSARQVMEHVGMPLWKLPVVTRFIRRRLADNAGSVRLFPGVAMMLEQLVVRDIHVGIVSTNTLESVRAILGPRDADLIEHYGCGASLFGKRYKLRRVLGASHVAPADAIYIGDEIRDLHAARGAGIHFGAVAWGYTSLDALRPYEPEQVFTRVEDIVGRLG
jgi:phosphoglycolate phosphatase